MTTVAAELPGTTAGLAVSVRDAGKMYRIYARPQDRLKQMMFSRLGRRYGDDFWALRHVTFDVKPGERFGVIGRNGSGKSTLLELMAGTLAPTEGEVEIGGRVAALLELGSGFNPEFTGRENVFMNAAIHGLTPEQIGERFDDIAAFADIGEFIDQPVKLYSSGMFVRLAFAVGTSIDADVLLIDEALAVGDVFFRQKCYRRLEVLREKQVSVVLVSHGMGDVEEFCDRALLLDHGKAQFVGPSVEAVKRYYLVESRSLLADIGPGNVVGPAPLVDHLTWPGGVPRRAVPEASQVSDGAARCLAIAVTDEHGVECHAFEQGQRACFWSEFEFARPIETPVVGMVIQNDKGTLVHGKSTIEDDSDVPAAVSQGERLRVKQEVVIDLALGDYTFEVALGTMAGAVYARRHQITHTELTAAIVRLCAVPLAGQFTVIFRRPGGRVQLTHHGVANLPGRIEIGRVESV